MWTLLFWKAALERAIKTFAQALLVLLSGDGVGLVDAPWAAALNSASMMTVLSVLFSIGSGFIPADPWTSPSAVRAAPRWASGLHRRSESLLSVRQGHKGEAANKDKAGTEPATNGMDDLRA